VLLLLLLLPLLAAPALGATRFPKPELPPDYKYPVHPDPAPRSLDWDTIDAALLVGALGIAAFLAHRTRRRWPIAVATVGALGYFGFVRGGCVCPIGAVQHVASACFDSGFVLPWVVLAFFTLPLVLAFFFGRVFCGSVCPLGAIQDVVLVRPLRVPRWLEHGLGLFAYLYLGLAVLFAANGAGYIICRYDPFVSMFRLSGPANLLIAGGLLLVVAMFVGRPYCRYLCPYGVMLRLSSKVSWRKVTVTPDECIQCRLCEDVCPYGAIRPPTAPADEGQRAKGAKRVGLVLLALPVLLAIGGMAGWFAGGPLSATHPDAIRLRELERLEADADAATFRTEAFLKTGRRIEDLGAEVDTIGDRFAVGGAIVGVFLALVVGGKLIGLSVHRTRTGYEPDPGQCVACGRCFKACPIEHRRRKKNRGEPVPDVEPKEAIT
jgi:ferredoxin